MADERVGHFELCLDGNEGVAPVGLAVGCKDGRHKTRKEIGGAGDTDTVLGMLREVAFDGDLEAGALVVSYVLFRHREVSVPRVARRDGAVDAFVRRGESCASLS